MADMVLVLAPDVEFQRPRWRGHARSRRGAAVVPRRASTEQGRPSEPHAAGRTGRYLPTGQAAVDPTLHQQPTDRLRIRDRAQVRTYYAVLSSFGLDHWGRYLDEFGVDRRRVAHHQAHGHDRGRRPRGMGCGPGVSARYATADHEHDARRPLRGDRHARARCARVRRRRAAPHLRPVACWRRLARRRAAGAWRGAGRRRRVLVVVVHRLRGRVRRVHPSRCGRHRHQHAPRARRGHRDPAALRAGGVAARGRRRSRSPAMRRRRRC